MPKPKGRAGGGAEGGGGGPGAKAKAQKAKAQAEKEKTNAHANEARKASQWSDGADARGNKKKQDQEQKDAEKAAQRQAKKDLEAREDAELTNMKPAAGKARKAAKAKSKKKKNDLSAIDAFLGEEAKAAKTKAAKAKPAGEDMLRPNRNREKGEAVAKGDVDASGVDNALAALDMQDAAATAGGKKPNRKALHMAFEEAEMPRMREENPGLKRSQLKERVWKEWLKSPLNPDNQEPA